MRRCFSAKYFFPLTLLIIVVIVCWCNYTPGTWLTGWDTLHPEVNFPLNFSRLLQGTWRADQGLGAVPAHSHMAELPRLVLIWVLSWVLPVSVLRYASVFIPFILGPLGVYFFLLTAVFPTFPEKWRPIRHPRLARSLAFVGSLFYLFNLGTAQHFYIVFEMFAYQYGLLPWLFLFVYRCFLPTRRPLDWAVFFGLSLAAAPMAYASQLWFAYLLGLGLFCGGLFLLSRQKFMTKLLVGCGILVVTLVTNAFWLLPNFYFLASGAAAIPAQAQINNAYSVESFLSNASFANWGDALAFRSYLFNWQKYNFTHGDFQDLLFFWKNYLDTSFGQVFPYLIAVLAGIGLVWVGWRRLQPVLALAPVGLFGLFVIMNAHPLFAWVFDFLRDRSGLLREGLRTPWTKFSLLLILVVCVLAAVGFYGLCFSLLSWKRLERWQKIKKSCLIAVILTLITACFYYGKPMFAGYLISPEIRREIPEAYFKFWEWSQAQSNEARLALVPLPTFTAWEYYDWGYEGPGFLWFGMPQSLLVRDFDRWSPYNEGFYRQLSTAFYDQDFEKVDEVLRQYHVDYLIDDKSMFLPNYPNHDIWDDRKILERLIATNHYDLVFTADNLAVYQVRAFPAAAELWIAGEKIQAETTYRNVDEIFKRQRPYYQQIAENTVATVYPFAALVRDEIPQMSKAANALVLEQKLPTPVSAGSVIVLPAFAMEQTEMVNLPAWISWSDNLITLEFGEPPVITLMGEAGRSHEVILPAVATVTATIPGANAANDQVSETDNMTALRVQVANRELTLVPEEKQLAILTVPRDGELALPLVQETTNGNLLQTLNFSLGNLGIYFRPATVEVEFPVTTVGVHLPATVAQTIDLTDATKLNACGFDLLSETKTMHGQTARYESMGYNQVTCDFQDEEEILNQFDYVLAISSSNETGRPLKITLEDQGRKHTMLNKLLPEGQDAESFLTTLAAPPELAGPLTLNWENRTLGQIAAVNELEQVTYIPAPLRWLSQIKLAPPAEDETTLEFKATEMDPSDLKTTLVAPSVIQSSITGYTLELNLPEAAEIRGDLLLTIDQAYENGWRATLDGQELKHVRVNGWQNGWLLPVADLPLTGGRRQVKISYWPQILENIGLATLIGGLVVIGLWLAWERLGWRNVWTHWRQQYLKKPLADVYRKTRTVFSKD